MFFTIINFKFMFITASRLYDFLQCPHKVWRDIYGPQEERNKEDNPFVELLWERGAAHEKKIVSGPGTFLDISDGSFDIRFQKTIEAMKNKTPLIYQGVLRHENLLGIPDLLKKLPDNTYMAIDIKSGMGYESADEQNGEEGKPKKHYAVQLCLYCELLKILGFSKHSQGRIIDISGGEVDYDLNASIGIRNKMTWWEFYENTKKHVDFLMKNNLRNKPALAGARKLCPWYYSCKKWCEETNDLSNIFYLGRSNRDTINEDLFIENIPDFLKIDIEEVMKEKKKHKQHLRGIAEKTLNKFLQRAKILYETKKPIVYGSIVFPKVSHELFFDIEDDPTQGFIYLHGVYERNGRKEQFVNFTAKEISEKAEKEAWQNFWKYIELLPQKDFAVYYYSHHEKTTYRKLQKRYPDVVSAEKVESFFCKSQCH